MIKHWAMGGHIHPQAVPILLLPHTCPQQHNSAPRLLPMSGHCCAAFWHHTGDQPMDSCTPHFAPHLSSCTHSPPVHHQSAASQPVTTSAEHTISQPGGWVPLESGSINKPVLLLFHSQPHIRLCQSPGRWACVCWRREARRGWRRKSIDPQLSPSAQGSPSYINICQAMHLCLSMAVNRSLQCCYLPSCHSQEPDPKALLVSQLMAKLFVPFHRSEPAPQLQSTPGCMRME